jgi:hypothetical protein
MDEATLKMAMDARAKMRRVRALVDCWTEECILRKAGEEWETACKPWPGTLEDLGQPESEEKPAKQSKKPQ